MVFLLLRASPLTLRLCHTKVVLNVISILHKYPLAFFGFYAFSLSRTHISQLIFLEFEFVPTSFKSLWLEKTMIGV
jgi:hypothetical protein